MQISVKFKSKIFLLTWHYAAQQRVNVIYSNVMYSRTRSCDYQLRGGAWRISLNTVHVCKIKTEFENV
jgi:hypothetical protein